MRANCDRRIWRGVCGSRLTEVSSCSWRIGDETMRRTRGLRTDWSAGAKSNGSLTGGFVVNSASAAWRALVIRSRSPRGCGCCCRVSKICSERLIHSRLSKGRGKFGKLDLGSRGAIRKRAPMRQPGPAALSTQIINVSDFPNLKISVAKGGRRAGAAKSWSTAGVLLDGDRKQHAGAQQLMKRIAETGLSLTAAHPGIHSASDFKHGHRFRGHHELAILEVETPIQILAINLSGKYNSPAREIEA
jgi:hypothetical protein